MYCSTLVLATLAATVSATLPLHKRYVEARQTDTPTSSADFPSASASDDAACISAGNDIETLLAAAPTVPADLESYAATATDLSTEDPCSYSFPSSLASEWSSFSSEYYSWFSASATAELSSALAACGTSVDLSDFGLCSTAADVASATGASAAATTTAATTASGASGMTTSTSGSATKTTASGSSGTAKATTTSTAGAVAREAGIVGAVFAGVLGAVVAL